MGAVFLKANKPTVLISVSAVSPDSTDHFEVEFLRHSIDAADKLLNQFNRLQRLEMGLTAADTPDAMRPTLPPDAETATGDDTEDAEPLSPAEARVEINALVKANISGIKKLMDSDGQPIHVVSELTPLDEAIDSAEASPATANNELLLADVLDQMLGAACYRVGIMNGFVNALINLGDEVRRKN